MLAALSDPAPRCADDEGDLKGDDPEDEQAIDVGHDLHVSTTFRSRAPDTILEIRN